CWNTKETSRNAGGSAVASRPAMAMMPASGFSRPATSRSSVVLPAPVGPSSTTSSPLGTVRLTSFAASTVPKRLVTRSITTSAMAGLFKKAALQRAAGHRIEHDDALLGEAQPHLLADASLARGRN